MTVAYDIVQASVLTVFALVIHRITSAIFNESGALYGIATDGTAILSGPQRAAFMADFFIIWLPLLIMGFAWSFAAVKAYKRQSVTAQRQVR